MPTRSEADASSTELRILDTDVTSMSKAIPQPSAMALTQHALHMRRPNGM